MYPCPIVARVVSTRYHILTTMSNGITAKLLE